MFSAPGVIPVSKSWRDVTIEKYILLHHLLSADLAWPMFGPRASLKVLHSLRELLQPHLGLHIPLLLQSSRDSLQEFIRSSGTNSELKFQSELKPEFRISMF